MSHSFPLVVHLQSTKCPRTRWSTYKVNCNVALSTYPETIPAGTSVPAWAYLDVSNSNNFNVTAARLNQQGSPPESTAGGPTSTASTSGDGGATGSTTPSPTTSASGDGGATGSKKNHSNTGAIIGGVVGGVGCAALLAAAAFWWRRRRRGHSLAALNGPGSSTNAETTSPARYATEKIYVSSICHLDPGRILKRVFV